MSDKGECTVKRGPKVWLAVLLFLGALSGCAPSSGSVAPSSTRAPASGSAPSGSAPGVSATQVDIGAISSKTGPLAGYFSGLAPGMTAYFKTVDAAGGINGRDIVLTDSLDDGGSRPSSPRTPARSSTRTTCSPSAVASAWFTPNYFVASGTPTYGYNVSVQLAGRTEPVRRRRVDADLQRRISDPRLLHQQSGRQVRRLHQLRAVDRIVLRRLQRRCRAV